MVWHRSYRLPDGAGTNGVVADVPRFPLVNCHRKVYATCDHTLQHVATCDNIWQHVARRAHIKQAMTTCTEMWPFCENPVCPDPVRKPMKIMSQMSRLMWPYIQRATCFTVSYHCMWFYLIAQHRIISASHHINITVSYHLNRSASLCILCASIVARHIAGCTSKGFGLHGVGSSRKDFLPCQYALWSSANYSLRTPDVGKHVFRGAILVLALVSVLVLVVVLVLAY